jgi:hypothetical protein
MSADPADADPLVDPLTALFAEIEAIILTIVARGVVEGWAPIRVRQQVGIAIAGYPQQIADAMLEALAAAQAAGSGAALRDVSGDEHRIPGPDGRRSTNLLMSIVRQAPSAAARMHQAVNDKVTQALVDGVFGTRKDAAAELLAGYARRGITGFTDVAGRNWDLVSYAEMVSRTTLAQTVVDSYLEQINANGHDLVVCSDAPEECPLCRPFEGRILSISGPTGQRVVDGVRVAVFATVASAVAAGLHHPNCRHRLNLYQPGLTKPIRVTRDPEASKLREQQRAKERAIRADKRAVLAAEAAGGKRSPGAVAARAKLRARQAEFKSWREQHDRKNLSGRTSLDLR